MKKFMTLISALVILGCGIVFSGCEEGDEIVNELAGPTQTWCSMPIEYKNADDSLSSANLYAHFYFTSTDVNSTSTAAAALKKGTTIPAGLTIVVTAASDASSVISGLTNNAYIMKTYPLDQEVAADDTDSSFKVTGSREKWSAIYWMKSELRQADNQSKNPPSQLSNNGSGTNLEWDSIKDQFSWKRLLANYLLNSL